MAVVSLQTVKVDRDALSQSVVSDALSVPDAADSGLLGERTHIHHELALTLAVKATRLTPSSLLLVDLLANMTDITHSQMAYNLVDIDVRVLVDEFLIPSLVIRTE